MIINIINRVSRTDRRKSVTEQMELESCSYKFWDGVEGKIPKENISKAHKQVIKEAKETNQKRCCVAEDDLIWTAPGAWEYFLKKVPTDFDVFVASYYTGGHDENFVVKGLRGLTLYIVAERYFDTLLALPENIHIDSAIAISGAKVVTCYPFAAIQTPGYSDQRKRYADDSVRLKNKEMFLG